MRRMSYSETTKSAMEKAADSVPIAIQLEVNAEIFTTVRNMLTSLPEESEEKTKDIHRLSELIYETLAGQAAIEERRGYGIDHPQQLTMLEEALAIKDRYLPHISFQKIKKTSTHFVPPDPSSTYCKEEADKIFEERVWPVISRRKPAFKHSPLAFLIGGQPGAGKTRMAASLLTRRRDLIHGDADSLLGFHPQYRKLQEQYGLYSVYITRHFADYMAESAFHRAVEERRHIMTESNLTDTEETLARIAFLHASGYRVIIILRACPRKESWLNLQQLYQQQLLKAPALARIVTEEYHDAACDVFVETALAIRNQHLFDRLIVRSDRGLLYDSDDLPTENIADLLRERLRRGEE